MMSSTRESQGSDMGDHYESALQHLKGLGVRLPTLDELARPGSISSDILQRASTVDPQIADPLNLFRIHWYNSADSKQLAAVPGHMVLPKELTGVDAHIVALLGERFPMITSHKVLPAYACLVPRLVSGEFDPLRHRAVWPSTGNYCRGGVAVSRILGCRGVAVLPEGMSAERFDWLKQWVSSPEDIIRTHGTESNVKEIYDACNELERDSENVIINQFSEYGNYLVHYHCTGQALAHVFASLLEENKNLQLAGFVAGTGSAGTLGAGDYLKEEHGSRIVVVEPAECPTLLCNGYGDHNIQGIGDKHVPLIHNVMNTDAIVSISDRSADECFLLFNTPEGRGYLAERRDVPQTFIPELSSLGLSGIANVLAAIRFARHYDLGDDSVVMTVATDNASLYESQIAQSIAQDFSGEFDRVHAGEVFGEHLRALGSSQLVEWTYEDRRRVFNLGYYTWVEQQNVPLDEFDARKHQSFWRSLRDLIPKWNTMVDEFNRRTGMSG